MNLYVDENVIQTTAEHPFWVKEKRTWIRAGNLNKGDLLDVRFGEAMPVSDVVFIKTDSPVKVFNLEVEGWHTYYVSDLDILVHNKAKKKNRNGDDERGGRITHRRLAHEDGRNQHGNTPMNNQRQNEQTNAIAREVGLSDRQARQLHDVASRQGWGFQRILEEAQRIAEGGRGNRGRRNRR